ncbi:MAG: pyrroline-5-carboxylate reductase [Solirubrobacterales bacterium]|nr:MAG: pyrroline-5-carboxylate reductase [Solirubrobacterales bacterium]
MGLIGAGNMARAMARGWGEPVLCTDHGSGRAAALAAELGGEAPASNAELAESADVVVLCHKPAQLEQVAREIQGVSTVVSVLGGVSFSALRAAYPSAGLVRAMPNTPVEVRQGVICWAQDELDADLAAALRDRFRVLGAVIELPEPLLDLATGLSGVGPAYLAVVAEAMSDSAIKHGLPPALATELVSLTLAGTAALLRAREGDTLAIRREVASPGGVTVRGLAALERAGLRAAFLDAADALASHRP